MKTKIQECMLKYVIQECMLKYVTSDVDLDLNYGDTVSKP